MKSIVLFLTACIFSGICNAQLQITNEPSAVALAQQLVGNGITISNVTFTGNSLMAGHFKNRGGTNINLDSGIVLTTGSAKTNNASFVTGMNGNGTDPSNLLLASTDWLLPGDPTLANAIDANVASMYDACVLEFDFVPLGDTVKFNYVFSSEEYEPIFACSEYIDAFGFFISGPGITGQKNIALVPGTNLPVSILNINNVMEFGSTLCPLNPAYYVDNSTNVYFTHEGHTVPLTAISRVQPCNVYHLKLVIADNSDGVWDSGVFLEAKSLTSNIVALTNNTQTDNSDNSYVVEGCNSGSFTVRRVQVSSTPLVVELSYGGNAINGVDVVMLPATVTIPANDSLITISVIPVADGITEGIEYLKVFAGSGCGAAVPFDSTIIQIRDYDSSITNVSVCSAQLPYNWNGNSYAAYGSYQITLINSVGCDSIATLNLTASAGGTSTTNVTICSNQLPYSWNGNSYPTAGTYLVTLTGTGTCDSAATLNLTVNNTVTSTTNVTICSNQLPYSWSGNSYLAAGIYSIMLMSSSGCDSVATLNLMVNNTVTTTTNVTVCNNQLPYSWNGNNYPDAGTYSLTLTSSSGCDSVATLNLIVNSTATSTTDVAVCNNQLPYNWNGNSYPAAGTYSVMLINTSGCDSVATLNLIVNNTVTSITDVTICNNQLPYSWSGNSYPTAGTYSITLSSTSGCDSVAILNLIVNSTVTSTTDATVCNNELPYSWSGNNYPAAGTYSITLTSSSGCDSVATLNLIVNSTVTSTTDVTICNSQLPYNWNGNSYPAAGTYSVTLTNSSSGCDSIATLNLIVNNTVTSTTDVTICNNQLPYSWSGNSYPAAGTYSVTLTNSSSGCDSIATLNLIVNNTVTSTTDVTICNNQLPYSWSGNSYPAAGTYSVTLNSSSGCDSVATLNLIVNNTVTSITDVAVCNNQLPYSWSGNSYPAAGTYSVTLNSSNGCDSVATLNLIVNNTVTSITDVAVCNNQLPYSWSGNNYPAAGTYSITLTSTSGCDSVATLNLIVNSTVTTTTDIAVCNDQLPYSWSGNNYPAPGIYSVTLTSTSGCDSVATLNLIVNNTVISTTDVAVCNNQLPYSWNGNSYPAAGTYSVTLVSSGGCDSIATLNLTANAVVTSTTDITICASQLPYNWNGNSYPAAGTYSVTLVSSGGCDSIATLNLTANAVVTSTTDVTICASQLPYNWNGNSYPVAGTYSVTLVSSGGCDSIATLNLTANAVVTSTTDVTICASQLPYIWNGQSYNTGGAHSVTLSTSVGCDSIVTLNLTINPVNTSFSVASACDNQLPYLWNGQGYNTPGIHTVTLTGSAGCDSIATLTLTINPVKFSTTNAGICPASLPYVWNGQSYNTGGVHTVTLTSSAGCDSVATLNLTVNPTPAAPAVTSPVVYCQHEPTTALGAIITTAGSQLVWYSSATGGTGSSTAPVPSSTNAGSTNYYVSQVLGPCEGPRAMITVTVNSKPDIGPDKRLQICFGQSANLTSLYNTGGYTAGWTSGQLPVNDPAAVTTAGIYQLVVQSPSGCADTALVTLGIQPPVIANAGPDDNAEYNVPYQLTGSGGVEYQWSPGDVLNNPFISNPLAVLNHDETFILMVKDEIGCADFDTVKLRVLKGPTFYVPTAFSPNGDGLNDIFRPTAVGIQDLEYFRVYNRYGELVFETHDIGQGWDGTYKGKKQNTGNYVWTIKCTDRLNRKKTGTGSLILIR